MYETIMKGDTKMGKNQSVTMKDVARMAGVSVGTVSRVINHEDGIKEKTLAKVNEAIKTLNYVPDVYARIMKTNRTETIALIVPSIWHPFFAEFAYYIEEILSHHNYKVILCSTEGTKDELDYLKMVKQNKVDGIIAVTYSDIDEYLEANIPFVSIDRTYADKTIACVTSDNAAGGTLAGETLIAKGCQNLAFIGTYNDTLNATKDRCIYFEKTIMKHGKNINILNLKEPVVDFDGELEFFLSKNDHIDGIFAINDFMALDTIRILNKLGKRVPEDVQIIGYDGIKFASDREYAVSTIKQPLEEMAKAAIDILFAIINNEQHQLQSVLPISYIDSTTTKK